NLKTHSAQYVIALVQACFSCKNETFLFTCSKKPIIMSVCTFKAKENKKIPERLRGTRVGTKTS
ncbi:unnamed protein product, partial [Heterotrigona itama]